MKKGLLLTLLIWICAYTGFAQTVGIINKKFVVNNNASCPIYFNGANTPWEAWNDFGGSYNSAKWTQDLVDLKNKGINSTRIWFSCDGNGQPNIATDGTVSAPTAKFWSDCDDLFAHAQTNGIYIYATMMSFDHTKTANSKSANWRAMMNSQAKTQTYIDNYLVPFINRYKNNPYFMAVDICNEIEWIHENTDNWQCSYAVLQAFVGRCASGMHQAGVARTDGSKVLVTLGSACVKWNGTKLPNGGTNPDGNKWSDANLKAQTGNDANAFLDFYSPHFYGWMEGSYSSPFEKTPTQYGMDDKACIVAEMPARDPMPTPAMSLTTAFNNLKNGGWQGHMPWTANITTNLSTEVGSLADFGAAAQAFANANSALVKPTCTAACATVAPTVTTPLTYCQNTTATALTANGTALKWYTVSTNGTALPAAPVPATTATGSTSYYVSQTLNGCEGPRATLVVTVNALPTASITAGGATTFCTGGSVTLTASAGSSYKWLNGTTQVGAASTYSATTSGSYTVEVTNANTCKATSAATTVTVNALPTATITAGGATTFCSGGSVTLTASAGSSYKWLNGTTQVGTASTYAATTSGSYTVEVTNTNTCKATSAATTVTVNALPTATITAGGATTFCTGGSVTLTASAGSSYKWLNGTTQVGTASTYSATTSGSYTVEVTNANTCKATSAAALVTVNPAPAPPTFTNVYVYCQNAQAPPLTATGTNLKWYLVASGGAGTATAPIPSTANVGSTDYYVSQTSGSCESARTAVTVTVNPPSPTPAVTGQVAYCQNAVAIPLSATGTNLQWYTAATGGTGNTTAPTPLTTATGTTNYYVTQITNFCESNRALIAVTVNALPTATITAGGATTFCAGGSVTLTASAGSSYKWLNGTTQVGTASTYNTTTSGSYTVEVTNANTCKATSAATTVTVNALPTATITAGGATTFCTGGSVTLTASAGSSYKWLNGTTQVGTASTYSATTSGSYTVEVTNANTCKATSAATTVTVNALPTATITAGGATTFCTGGSVTLTASAGSSYKWLNGTTQVGTASTYSVTTSGSYTVEVTNANTCKATSAATTVTVNPLPTAAITVTGPTTVCTGGVVALTSSPGSFYVWKNSGTNVGSGSNGTFNAFASGIYSVEVTNANNCKATSAPVTVTITSATTWYEDADGDGKGDPDVTTVSCSQPAGYVLTAGDNCPDDAAKSIPGNCGCGKTEASCLDCAGVPNGSAAIDACQVCSGGTTGITPITNAANCPTTATLDLSASDAVKIIPNPSNDRFNLILTQTSAVQILTAEGKLVELFSQVNNLNFGEGYAKGVYFVQISNGSSIQVLRVIKQ